MAAGWLLIVSPSWSHTLSQPQPSHCEIYLTCDCLSRSLFFLPPPVCEASRRGLCGSHLFFSFFFPHVGYFWVYTVVRDWNRILGFFSLRAGSWSRQTQSRLTSSRRRFPRRSAVCVNTLFLRWLPRWRPAVGLLSVRTHGAEEKSVNWHHQSAKGLPRRLHVRLVKKITKKNGPEVMWPSRPLLLSQ